MIDLEGGADNCSCIFSRTKFIPRIGPRFILQYMNSKFLCNRKLTTLVGISHTVYVQIFNGNHAPGSELSYVAKLGPSIIEVEL